MAQAAAAGRAGFASPGQRIITRLTQKMGLQTPIVSAPMAGAAPPRLAAAVSNAGGLGLIGGGYCDLDIEEAFNQAGAADVGIGFITWALARRPAALQSALARRPKAVMLSFGDPAPFAADIKDSGAALICQCQTLVHVQDALAVHADIIVAQGSEAGGHGAVRGTMSFVAETARYLKMHSPSTLLVAAGGIADGRGLAAALMLGADGVLMGSRFWASAESGVGVALQEAAVQANGDATVRTSIPDLARGKDWPREFDIRVLKNAMIREWHPLSADVRSCSELRVQLQKQYQTAASKEDPDNAGVVVGEAAGLIHDRPSAKVLVQRITHEATDCLSNSVNLLAKPASAL